MAELKLECRPRLRALSQSQHPDHEPVLAAVNGGRSPRFLLAQMCDRGVAAEHARFAITSALGRGAPWRRRAVLTAARRARALDDAEPIDARRALEIGLVNRGRPRRCCAR